MRKKKRAIDRSGETQGEEMKREKEVLARFQYCVFKSFIVQIIFYYYITVPKPFVMVG